MVVVEMQPSPNQNTIADKLGFTMQIATIQYNCVVKVFIYCVVGSCQKANLLHTQNTHSQLIQQ